MISALDCATGRHLRSATLRPACKEGSYMDPTLLPHAPYGPDSETAFDRNYR